MTHYRCGGPVRVCGFIFAGFVGFIEFIEFVGFVELEVALRAARYLISI